MKLFQSCFLPCISLLACSASIVHTYQGWDASDDFRSGSGDDAVEIFEEIEPYAIPTRIPEIFVCRKARLVTWVPDDALVDKTAYLMKTNCSTASLEAKNGIGYDSSASVNRRPDANGVWMDQVLPVTSQSTNVTYYNRGYFLCSGDLGPPVTWAINVSCRSWVDLQSRSTGKEVLHAALDSGACSLALQPPPALPVTTCSKDNRVPDGSGDLLPQGPVGMRPLPSGAALSILLDFWDSGRSGEEPQSGREDNGRAEKGNVSSDADCAGYLLRRFGETQCLPLNCAPGKRLANSSCIPVIQRVTGFQYSLTLRLDVFVVYFQNEEAPDPKYLFSLCTVSDIVQMAVHQKTLELHSKAYTLVGWKEKHDSDVNSSFTDSDNASDFYFQDSIDMQNSMKRNARQLSLGKVLIWFDFFITNASDRTEIERSALEFSEDEWFVICGHTQARLVPTLWSRSPQLAVGPPTDLTENIRISFSKTVAHPDHRVVNAQRDFLPITVSPSLLCPHVTIPKDQYTTIPDADQRNSVNLTIMNISRVIPASDLEIDKAGYLKICDSVFEVKFEELLPITEDGMGEDDFSWVLLEHYVSLVCVCLSLVGLLLTLITYTLFRSLRTIPGQNMMALCFNLLVAQALLQFGVNWPELKSGCIALGILTHYFWLCTVFWMNVCSFHMYRVFTSKRATRTTSPYYTCCTRLVVAYAVYAQGVPLIVIGTTVTSNIAISEGHEVGYGTAICFLSSRLLVGIVFAAPLAMVLIVNLIFFLVVAREIAKTEIPVETSNEADRKACSHDTVPPAPFSVNWRRNLNVCMRLSTLTGLFWALGFVAELLDQRVLRLLSVLVNGSQGLMIAFSYLPTRRVLRLYSQACCAGRGKQQTPSTTASDPAPVDNNLITTLYSSADNTSANDRGNVTVSDI